MFLIVPGTKRSVLSEVLK
uniref:Uncharacterized protein n=1 Tax=Anopheles minimus TaxID=112268 RepID=A0A182WQ36_9DIPT